MDMGIRTDRPTGQQKAVGRVRDDIECEKGWRA